MVVAVVTREIVISVVVVFFFFLSFSFGSGRERFSSFFYSPLDWNFTYLDINAPTRAETSSCDHMVLFF